MFENDTYSYKGWMTSDYFLKRAFGALLYQMCAALIVYGIILAVVIVVIIFAVMFMGMAGLVH
jgi:hypothetical protein